MRPRNAHEPFSVISLGDAFWFDKGGMPAPVLVGMAILPLGKIVISIMLRLAPRSEVNTKGDLDLAC